MPQGTHRQYLHVQWGFSGSHIGVYLPRGPVGTQTYRRHGFLNKMMTNSVFHLVSQWQFITNYNHVVIRFNMYLPLITAQRGGHNWR